MARNYHRHQHVSHQPLDPDDKPDMMKPKSRCHAGSLSCVGVLWAILSFLSMGATCVGFYLPYWLKGTLQNHPAFLGTFRRCNYLSLNAMHQLEMVFECGRYTEFADIPSIWWQVTTITVGIGCGLGILVAFTALLSCCLDDVLSHTIAKGAGIVQFLAALSTGAGCLLYPFGWETNDVRQVCGPEAKLFELGHCEMSWAYMTTIGGAGGLLLSSLLSCCAAYKPRRRSRNRAAHQQRER